MVFRVGLQARGTLLNLDGELIGINTAKLSDTDVEGMGYAIGLDRLINTTGSDLCFRPLSPRLTARLVVAWKKHQVMSKASGAFLNALKKASEPLRDTEDGDEKRDTVTSK